MQSKREYKQGIYKGFWFEEFLLIEIMRTYIYTSLHGQEINDQQENE